MTQGSNRGPRTSKPRSLPAPRSSRTPLSRRRMIVKPAAVPRASSSDRATLFREANASARPRMMQLTTMSATKGPSCLWTTGTAASRSRSASVTKVAMISTYEVMRTSCGMNRLREATSRFEPSRTNPVAIAMASPFATLLVTASTGQSPSICTTTGFSRQTPRRKSSKVAGLAGFIGSLPVRQSADPTAGRPGGAAANGAWRC